MMKRLLLLANLAVLPVFANVMVPLCTGLALDQLMNLSLGDLFVSQCIAGDKAFGDFLSSSTEVSASSVTLIGLDTPSNNRGLRFTGCFGPAAGGSAIESVLGYTGYKEWCAADFLPYFPGQLVHENILLSGSSGTASSAPGVDFVDVYLALTAHSDVNVDTVVTQFNRRFSQVVPEAGSMLLLGSGVLALAWGRRKALRQKQLRLNLAGPAPVPLHRVHIDCQRPLTQTASLPIRSDLHQLHAQIWLHG